MLRNLQGVSGLEDWTTSDQDVQQSLIPTRKSRNRRMHFNLYCKPNLMLFPFGISGVNVHFCSPPLLCMHSLTGCLKSLSMKIVK